MPSKTKAELAAENSALRERLAELESQPAGALETLRVRTQQLESVQAISTEIVREMRLPVLLELIIRHAIRLVGGANGTILLWDEGRGVLVPAAWIGSTPVSRESGIRLGDGVTGTVAIRRKGMIVNDYRTSPFARPIVLERTGITADMAEPLLYRDRLIGVIDINNGNTGRTFSDEHAEVLRLFATQAAIAIENARTHEAALRREEELEALLRASRTVMAGLDLQSTLDQIAAEASRIAQCKQVKLLLVDREAQVLRVGVVIGLPSPLIFPCPIGDGLSGIVAQTGQTLFIADCQSDPRNPASAVDREKGLRTYLGLPIKARGEVLGVLTFNTTEPREYSPEEMAYLTSFADQAAIAIDNARLFAVTERAAREARSLYEVAHSLTTSLDPLEILRLIALKTTELLGTSHAQVVLWDDAAQSLQLGAAYGTEAVQIRQQEFRLGEGVTGIVAQSRKPLIVNDYQAFPNRVKELVGIVASLAVPLLYRGRLLGVLGSHTTQSGSVFTQEHLNLLGSFANHAAVALENARLHEATARRAQQLATLIEITQALTTELNPHQVSQQILVAAQTLIPASAGRLWERVEEDRSLRVIGSLGLKSPEDGQAFLLVPGEGLLGIAEATRQPAVSIDVTRDPRFLDPEWAAAEGLVSCIILPLDHHGRIVGFLTIYTRIAHEFTAEEMDLLRVFASQAAIAIANARLYEAAQREIAERARAEEALSRYRLLAERARDIVLFVRRDGQIVEANQAAVTTYGYMREELLTLHIQDLRAPETLALTADQMTRAEAEGILFETEHRRKDGGTFPVEVSSCGTTLDGERVLLSIIRDISERRRAEEERHRIETQMQHTQKLESLGVLAGGIAHDFNNLLVAILGYAELALLELSPASPARNHLKEIETASYRAADLCRQMLAYSGKGRFVVQALDLSEVVREMTHILEVAISKKASLQYHLASQLPSVQADATQIRQVIMNLITNASEALGDQAGIIRVTTSVIRCDRAYLRRSRPSRGAAGGGLRVARGIRHRLRNG